MIAQSKKDLDIEHEEFTDFRIGLLIKVHIKKDGEIIKTINAGAGDKIIINGKEYTVETQDMEIEI